MCACVRACVCVLAANLAGATPYIFLFYNFLRKPSGGDAILEHDAPQFHFALNSAYNVARPFLCVCVCVCVLQASVCVRVYCKPGYSLYWYQSTKY
jgi:hypothetical protein